MYCVEAKSAVALEGFHGTLHLALDVETRASLLRGIHSVLADCEWRRPFSIKHL